MAEKTTDPDKPSWQEELRANLRVIWLSITAAPLMSSGTFTLTVIEGLIPAIIVTRIGRFISVLPEARAGGSDSIAWQTAMRSLIVLGVVIAGSQILKPIKEAFQYGQSRKFQMLLSRKVMAGVTSTPGIAHFEDPAFRDKLEVSEWIGWAPAHSAQMVGQMVQQAVTAISLTYVAASYSWWVPLLLLGTSVPAGFAAFNRVRSAGLAIWQDSPEIRRANYYRSLAFDLEPAKEMRLFGLKKWTLDRQRTHFLQGMRETWRKRRFGTLLVMGLHVLSVGGLVVVYLSMLYGALDRGPSAAGDFVARSAAAAGVLTATVTVFSTASWIRRMNYLLPFVLRLVDVGKKDPRMDVSGTRSAHGLARQGITFENVRFGYPGTERTILDDLSLHIPPGQSVALVGENGAGKTTLIKLMCRFYDPDEGRVLLDGVDIREFDLEDYRRRIACIFQDFTRYELPVRDNVGFGSVGRRNDDALLVEAASRVGVLEEIEKFPDGWETPLSRQFGGVDLSGGQWQRIALARAIMAQLGHDADVLILDEPTASLDVRLEHELYEHFAELARGRTTLLVSHRFSTVRMAQRIVYMEGGRVVEDGPHAELMEKQGRYAELYSLQAQHYLATGALE